MELFYEKIPDFEDHQPQIEEMEETRQIMPNGLFFLDVWPRPTLFEPDKGLGWGRRGAATAPWPWRLQ